MLAVYYDSDEPVYYPGQPITGRVDFELTDPQKLRAVYLKVHGTVKTNFKTGFGKNREHHHSSLDLVCEKILLKNYEEKKVPAGKYSFPFTFVLPTDGLLCSYESKNGHVHYHTAALLDIPWGFDQEVKKTFIVNSIVDLNNIPQARLGVKGENCEKLTSCCTNYGTISFEGSICKGGYVVGEPILLQMEVYNRSKAKANAEAKLMQHTTYTCGRDHKHCDVVLQQRVLGTIEANSNKTFSEINFTIPQVPPTNLGGCSIIKISYCVKCIVHSEVSTTCSSVDIPITIGTVPLIVNPMLPFNEQ